MFRFFSARKTPHPVPGIGYVDMDLHHQSPMSEVYQPDFLSPLNGVQQGYTFVSQNPPAPIQPPPVYIPVPTPPLNPQAGQLVGTIGTQGLFYVDGETNPAFS